MSKELTPLQALNNIKNLFIGSSINPAQQFEIIETALKKLDKPKEIVGTTTVDKALEQFLIDSCPEVAKKLKALEIIKNKILDMDYFNIIADRCDLTQEEYELLKEVLK